MVNRRNILYLFVLSLTVTIVLAAGGGGGGGGSGGGSSGGGDGGITPYADLTCTDAGVLSFTRGAAWDAVTVQLSDGSLMENISGEWKDGAFTSEEAIMVKAGTYIVLDPQFGNKSIECPGLRFSCKLVKLNLDECTTNGNITAAFTLENATVDDLKFQFSLPDSLRKLRYEKNSFSSELKEMTILKTTAAGYHLQVKNAPTVSELQITVPQCVGKYYRYTTMKCVEKGETPAPEETGGKLKCGGYLDIEDRVKCRLDLREEQADEYENFFPEECRSWKDQKKCVQLYKAVQNCWKLPNSIARISCLQGKVGIINVREQKSTCGEDQACLQKLREDVYTLIKLRLYNLEEEAEEWMEEGKLSKDDVADFVIKMEQSKLAFNQAQNKQERKQVIMQARQYWLELVKKVSTQ